MPKLPQDVSSFLDDRRDDDPTRLAALGEQMQAQANPGRPPSRRSPNAPRRRGPLIHQGNTPAELAGTEPNLTDIDDRVLGRPGTATPKSQQSMPQKFTTNTTPPEIARQRMGWPGFTSQLQDQLNGAGQSRSQRWYGSMPKPDAAQDQDD